MVKIRIQRPNPDGLDPVYQAYQLLRELFNQAKVEEDHITYEDGSYAGSHDFLVLPTGDAYPADDINPLDELEAWLAEQFESRWREMTDEG
jgi:hypothetical protein